MRFDDLRIIENFGNLRVVLAIAICQKYAKPTFLFLTTNPIKQKANDF